MNELKIFEREEFGKVRTLEENGKVLFCGKDVAKALGYSNARDAIKKHCLSEGVAKRDTPTASGIQTLNFIDEGNLYRLITHSRLPSAQKFERWVFDEVLPSIRKTGGYLDGNGADEVQQEFNIQVLKMIANLTEIVMSLKNQIPAQSTVVNNKTFNIRDEVMRDVVRHSLYRTHLTKVDSLPEREFAEVVKMIAGGVPYITISERLNDMGYEISKSSIGRFKKTIDVMNVSEEKTEILFKDHSMFTIWNNNMIDRLIY